MQFFLTLPPSLLFLLSLLIAFLAGRRRRRRRRRGRSRVKLILRPVKHSHFGFWARLARCRQLATQPHASSPAAPSAGTCIKMLNAFCFCCCCCCCSGCPLYFFPLQHFCCYCCCCCLTHPHCACFVLVLVPAHPCPCPCPLHSITSSMRSIMLIVLVSSWHSRTASSASNAALHPKLPPPLPHTLLTLCLSQTLSTFFQRQFLLPLDGWPVCGRGGGGGWHAAASLLHEAAKNRWLALGLDLGLGKFLAAPGYVRSVSVCLGMYVCECVCVPQTKCYTR